MLKNSKIEYQHLILHFRISLDTKFQLKLKILIFLEQFCYLCRVSLIENGKSEHNQCIFELLGIPNFTVHK